jgi:hypothetical protein
VVSIDQGAIRGSRRSNPATYTGLLDPIRQAFAKANGVKPALFSANSEGACPNCNRAGQARTPAAHAILDRLADVGLGYLSLGQRPRIGNQRAAASVPRPKDSWRHRIRRCLGDSCPGAAKPGRILAVRQLALPASPSTGRCPAVLLADVSVGRMWRVEGRRSVPAWSAGRRWSRGWWGATRLPPTGC